MEPDEVKRWQRNARAMGRKADDAEGLAQVLQLVAAFEDEAMAAISRLKEQTGFSWAYLALPLGVSRQNLQQRHAWWVARQLAAAERQRASALGEP